MPPTLGHGKICYLILPATDVRTAAAFYQNVFGWRIRMSDDEAAFDDGVGEVSGMWLRDVAPIDARFVHIMTDDAERTCQAVTREGGEVLEPPDAAAPEITAVFKDPAGNRFSIYQERSLASRAH